MHVTYVHCSPCTKLTNQPKDFAVKPRREGHASRGLRALYQKTEGKTT